MKQNKKVLSIAALTAASLLMVGCLVSGTFVIVEDVSFDFTANTGFYWYPVDLTGNADWEDHKDDIDFIDAVGFSFTIQNTSAINSTLSVKFVAASGTPDMSNPPTSIPAGAVTVIDGLAVAAGATRVVTYSESLGMISNVAALKDIIKSGRFDYYGTSTAGSLDGLFVVTEGKIIVTVSASST